MKLVVILITRDSIFYSALYILRDVLNFYLVLITVIDF
jgi:hypothetical protein